MDSFVVALIVVTFAVFWLLVRMDRPDVPELLRRHHKDRGGM